MMAMAIFLLAISISKQIEYRNAFNSYAIFQVLPFLCELQIKQAMPASQVHTMEERVFFSHLYRFKQCFQKSFPLDISAQSQNQPGIQEDKQ